MSQTGLETKKAAQYAALVTLVYGDKASPTVTRYTSWTENLVISGNTFLSEPTLDIELADQHGGTDNKETNLTIDAARTPFDLLATGYGFSKVWVTIEQIDPADFATRRQLFYGSVSKVIQNPSRKKGLCRCKIASIKDALNGIRLSLPMTTTCCVPFGGEHCQLDASSWEQAGTVIGLGSPTRTSVSLTLPGVMTPATQIPDNHFAKGTLVVDGRSYRIKKSYENGTFDLDELPPPWIIGKICRLYPGCRKRLEDCRVWNNEEHFMGLGIKIPPRNPVFEQG